MEKIVINGCNGNCCERFTLKYSIEDFKAMIELKEKGERIYTSKVTGKEERIDSDSIEDMRKIMNMLIPLGETDICPQQLEKFNDLFAKVGWTEKDLVQENTSNFIIKDRKVTSLVYTCKHFNKEKRMCMDYENRPNMCRSFGSSCLYQGCDYKAQLAENMVREEKEEMGE